MSAVEIALAALSAIGAVAGSLALFKLRGKAPPNGKRLR